MSAPSPKLACLFCAVTLIAAAPSAFASGGGGFSQSTSMPSQSQFDPSVEYRKGVDALKAEKYTDAEHAFAHVLSSNSHDANGHFMMGLAQAGQGKLADARGHYERAIKYDDSLTLAHMELGLTLVKLGETDKATAVLDDLKKRSSACADTCAQAKDLQSAVSSLESALAPQASPASPASPATSQVPAERDLLGASIASGDHDYLDAVALINQKRYEDAITALQASSRVFGPHPDILTYIGYANRKLGRFDIAEDYYRQALAAAPNHLGATEYYGELMVERGDLAGARRMLAKLENTCSFGCAQADELRRWVVAGKQPSS
ncbi:MAG TPA: tetratricopeptide repeat protein [Xanthomonadaceae bacterium]|jgi:tetratricopeptide (TPR) repeat protein